MTLVIRQNVIPFLLAVLLLFVTVPFVESVQRIYGREPAIEWTGVKVETPEVRLGGTLQLTYGLKVNRQCPSDLRGFIVAADGSVPVRLPPLAGGYTKPSDNAVETHVRVAIPMFSDPGLAPLVPGEYTLRTLATRFCPDGIEDDSNIPDAPFRIVGP